ncbi:helicase-related protein [Planococcus shenhongbingii]|uniref:Helicase-related protein n=1 Tax=Planococcus shenhongbingii TaxID=3058398 RepID=A0ABT8NA66_9BACL|nr:MULTISPECIES: DEAD/DEAH box helicase [unclassified Planococcus (in: firmicutes)]MDN7244445.1 helicase-related protein [Planococcus sp. N017]WKA57607.1 helicase-related protein [Planococcus sp. N016]
MPELEEFLNGRIWLRNFTPFSEDLINEAIAKGFITVTNGIADGHICARCLEKSPHKIISFYCSNCDANCLYCRHCIKMGRVSSCTELITWKTTSSIPSQNHLFSWNGTLTALQQRASAEVSSSLSNGKSHLVYAVCGAGKTELLFTPIFEALQKGQRVCIAAPRTDVVLELSPRIKATFPNTIVHTLYGGAPIETGFSNIVIATTHQLYRFQEAFDVMIVDEADAFPYSYDPALERAVIKAKKKEAPIVYVSATPSAALLKKVENRSEIFRRFHGHALPVPVFEPLWNYKKVLFKNKIPPKLAKWVQDKLSKNEPFLLFLPTIELIVHSIKLFQELDPRIEAVHAQDPERKEKVLKLRNGEVRGLLTSTILERGITIPNVQVAVVGADDRIFEASALIQIAGRAGRAAANPKGDVVFFHDGIVREMDRARQKILSYNRRGLP